MSGHVPEKLVEYIKNTYRIDTFIETGTYKGKSTLWAAQIFENVYTIEAYEPYYKGAIRKFKNHNNVVAYLGDSRELLCKVLCTNNTPAILWLDAHWIGNAQLAHEQKDECPILEELASVVQTGVSHFILIDDARLFLSKPQKPHDPAQWPSYCKIETILDGWDLNVKNDIIICVPKEYSSTIFNFVKVNDIR